MMPAMMALTRSRVYQRGEDAGPGAGQRRAEGGGEGVDAGNQQRRDHGAAERIAALGRQVGKTEEAEGQQHAET